MTDYRGIEQRVSQALGLTRRPVAVTFRDSAPAGVSRFSGSEPSGCSFWRLAREDRTFFTVPSDHYNCAIGSHTSPRWAARRAWPCRPPSRRAL